MNTCVLLSKAQAHKLLLICPPPTAWYPKPVPACFTLVQTLRQASLLGMHLILGIK